MIRRDAHHLCFDRQTWEARPEGYEVRSKLIAHGLCRTAHNLIHLEQSAVPVPLYPSLQYLARRLRGRGDIFDTIDEMTELLYGANEMKYAKPVEVEINLLCIEALENQLPYLQEGLPCPTYIDLAR